MVVKRGRRGVLALAALSVFALGLGGCRGETPPDPSPAAVSQPVDEETQVVRFDRELGGYAPKKKELLFHLQRRPPLVGRGGPGHRGRRPPV